MNDMFDTHPLHACGLKWGCGTLFGLIFGVLELDFDVLDCCSVVPILVFMVMVYYSFYGGSFLERSSWSQALHYPLH